MAATLLGMERTGVKRYTPPSGPYDTSFLVARPQNFVAATGKTFDYPIILAAYEADGTTVDTTFTGLVTAAVTTGTCTLGGTVSRNAVSGVVDFSDLYPATGTGSLGITFSASGLTSFVTDVMAVVTPDHDAYGTSLGLSWEKPRLAVDETVPTVFTRTITVGAGQSVVAGVSYQTVQDAYDYCIDPAHDITGNTQILVDAGTYGKLLWNTRDQSTGWIVIRPASGDPGTAGTRISPAEVTAAGVTFTSTDQQGTIQTPGAAWKTRVIGCEITKTFGDVSLEEHNAVCFIHNDAEDLTTGTGTIGAQPTYIGFDRCWIHGAANYTLRKGILFDARDFFAVDCYIDEVHATIGEAQGGAVGAVDHGSGDEQAIASVAGAGPGLVRNCMLRCAGEVMMFGGDVPPWPSVVTRDVTISRCVFYSPTAWQGIYKFKNTFEFKAAHRVWVDGCVFDGAWDGNQDGMGLHVSSGNQDGLQAWASEYAFQGSHDIVISNSFSRTMQGWLSLTATIIANSDLARRIGIYNHAAVNIDAPVTWFATGSSQIKRAAYIGGGLTDCAVGHCTIVSHPSATQTEALLVADTTGGKTNPTSYYRDNISVAYVPGVNLDGGSNGETGYLAGFPDDGTPRGNVFYAFDNTYPYNYTLPTDLTPNFAPDLASVGFTDVSGIASFNTADPETIVAGLALATGSTYKGVASDGTDPGADIPTLLAAITGVWAGSGASSGTPTQLLLSTQPAGAVSGQPLTQQPVVRVADAGGATVTSDTSTVTASWVLLTGDAVPTGTLTKAASSGVATFATLALTWTVPSTGYWHFTDGSLTSVNSSTMTLSVAPPPPPPDDDFGIVRGDPVVFRMARGRAVFAGYRRSR